VSAPMPGSLSGGGPRNRVTGRGSQKALRARRRGAAAYAGSSTSTGPFAITDPSWLVMVTSNVTSPAPRVLS
jgi:hypothetical protein